MFATSIRRVNSTLKGKMNFATVIRSHNNKNASAPLIEKYRPTWPDSDFAKSAKPDQLLPRTIPDEVLNFELTASLEHGSAIFYPHLPTNPADIKVRLTVSIDKLGLNAEEQQIFIRMVGSRYNVGKREVKLTSDQFPNRIENKRHLTLLLENLVHETKSLHKQLKSSK